MEKNLEKWKEVVSKHGPGNKQILQLLHGYYGFRDIEQSWRPIFQFLFFFIFLLF